MKPTILLIDDDDRFVKACAKAMKREGYDCDICYSASEAQIKFHNRLYDGIVCDVLIPFNGVREGGLMLAREFATKYPSSCMVLVSQYVTDHWVNEFAGLVNHAFVEKRETVIKDLVREVGRIVKSKFAFISMPFSLEFENFYEVGIKSVVQDHGFKCVRVDEIEHNTEIMQIVRTQIESAHVIIADMTGKNANVYYEVGYAHALRKDVILLTQRIDDLPFNLRGFNHIVYEGRIVILKEKLAQRMKAIQSIKRQVS